MPGITSSPPEPARRAALGDFSPEVLAWLGEGLRRHVIDGVSTDVGLRLDRASRRRVRNDKFLCTTYPSIDLARLAVAMLGHPKHTQAAGVALGWVNETQPPRRKKDMANPITEIIISAVDRTKAAFASAKVGLTQLSATYRLAEAQKQLNALREDGFDEDHSRVEQLNAWIPKLQALVDAETALEKTRLKNSKDTSSVLVENRAEETKAFKDSINGNISDSKRLQSALISAFDESLKSEADYLRQAKKLRAEAGGKTTVGDDPESQALARMGALTAAMKLQRIAGTETLENVQDQAEALRALADPIVDTALKSDLLKQANLAEAAALETAAVAEGERAKGLAQQQKLNQERAGILASPANKSWLR